jgi:flagellum-specific peptidoglycan hydrolase FlgJ
MLAPSVSLAWQGSSPWIWSQWRFDKDDKWRAKWVIRQENLSFCAQDLSRDAKATTTVKSISEYVEPLQRIDVEMDITCIDDQYAITLTSNLDAWLPQIVKMVYRAEEQEQLEKVRTAIQQHKDRELSLLREEVTSQRDILSKDAEPALARLEKLSTDLASKLGVSPRVMLSQESGSDLKR